jgi:hypothetical protein
MAVAITIKDEVLERGSPHPLFQTRIAGGGVNPYQRAQYDVAADGRFLILAPEDTGGVSPITLLQNWNPARVRK